MTSVGGPVLNCAVSQTTVQHPPSLHVIFSQYSLCKERSLKAEESALCNMGNVTEAVLKHIYINFVVILFCSRGWVEKLLSP